jgi:hypothetical protein
VPVASLTIIIPTIGRKSLLEILGQIVPQLSKDDRVLVVGDGAQPKAAAMMAGYHAQVAYHEYGPTKCWGHPQRNWAMLLAETTHIWCLDDDDEVLPGAVAVIRQAADDCPGKLLIFKIHHREFVIPKEPEIRLTNVSTQCFVFPNTPDRFGSWGFLYEGDLQFALSSVERHPDKLGGVVWRPEIIAIHGDAMDPKHKVDSDA